MLTTTRDGAVSLLVLERDDRRNALDPPLCRALLAAAHDEVAHGARVLVLTGRGSSFCSGAELDAAYDAGFLDALYGLLHGLADLPVPVVAAVNGPAVGAGTQLALACDLRVGDVGARFSVPTARNGMAVDAWTIRTLAAVAGGGVARRLMLAAETLGRDEALACGLLDRSGDLAETLAWARDLAGLAPLALAHAKAVLNGADDEAAARSFARCWASDDVHEGREARAQRRAPVFRGR